MPRLPARHMLAARRVRAGHTNREREMGMGTVGGEDRRKKGEGRKGRNHLGRIPWNS